MGEFFLQGARSIVGVRGKRGKAGDGFSEFRGAFRAARSCGWGVNGTATAKWRTIAVDMVRPRFIHVTTDATDKSPPYWIKNKLAQCGHGPRRLSLHGANGASACVVLSARTKTARVVVAVNRRPASSEPVLGAIPLNNGTMCSTQVLALIPPKLITRRLRCVEISSKRIPDPKNAPTCLDLHSNSSQEVWFSVPPFPAQSQWCCTATYSIETLLPLTAASRLERNNPASIQRFAITAVRRRGVRIEPTNLNLKLLGTAATTR